jgi:hypothetical protein
MTVLVNIPLLLVGDPTDIMSALLDDVASAACLADIHSRIGSFLTPE